MWLPSEPETKFCLLIPSATRVIFCCSFLHSGHTMGDNGLRIEDFQPWMVYDLALLHVSTCQTGACTSYRCWVIKRLVMHSSGCRRGFTSDCPDCRLLLRMCHLENHGNCIVDGCATRRCRQLQQLLGAERARMRCVRSSQTRGG